MMSATNTDILARLNSFWHFMSAVDLKNIDELCRLCMSKEDVLTPIFYTSSRNQSYDLSKWIFECTTVEVYNGDGLPSKICRNCHKQLREWAEFRRRSQEINTTLISCQYKAKLVGLTPDHEVPLNEDHDDITIKEERIDHDEDGNNIKKEELLNISVDPMESNDDEACIDEKMLEDSPESNETSTNATVLGSEQNSKLTENDKSTQENISDNLLTCKKSGEAFATEVKLKEHDVSHSKEKPFQCTVCRRTFSMESIESEEILDNLEPIKSEELPVNLVKPIKNEEVLVTVVEPIIKVENNDEKACNDEKLLRDSPDSKEIPPNTTVLGNIPNSQLKENDESMQENAKSTQENYISDNLICKKCGEAFTTEVELKEHEVVHSKEKPFHCTLCTRTFSKEKYLDLHMRCHAEEKDHICEWTAAIKLNTNYANLRGVPGASSELTLCRQCGKEKETPFHVIGSCSYYGLLINSRHHNTKHQLRQLLEKKGYHCYEEVFAVDCEGSRRFSDIFAFRDDDPRALIVDPTIRYETNDLDKATKLQCLRTKIHSQHLAQRTHATSYWRNVGM
ncbi:hypothetical protein C0J52_11133 [Blattella germanica]|nr:hypothetical protein C0J52_11133 [Blattella germanica]